MKILIIRFSSIGDIILTSPVIRTVRKKYPNAQIHFATKNEFSTLLASNENIDMAKLLGDSFVDFVKEINAEKYDLIIDLHKNTRSQLIHFFSRAHLISYDKLNVAKWTMTAFKINHLPKIHLVDRYFDALRKIDIMNDGKGLDFFITAEDRLVVVNADLQNKPFIAWAIGAKFFTKQFPVNKILETLALPAMQSQTIVLLGGREDATKAQEILKSSTHPNLLDLTAKLNLQQSAAVVEASTLLITNDTGMMHIAAALKKPTISLWGNTIPDFGMYPYYGQKKVAHKMLAAENISCRPCSKIGFAACPKGHFDCMQKIDVTMITEAIRSIVQAF